LGFVFGKYRERGGEVVVVVDDDDDGEDRRADRGFGQLAIDVRWVV
jgi:hypothetical protein